MKDIYELLNHIEIDTNDFKKIKTTRLEEAKTKENLKIIIKKQYKTLNK
ncbi:hypothetical protein [Bacillus pseudomycoides]|nr:hypothetical protein [Bacillus pseudomycoides]